MLMKNNVGAIFLLSTALLAYSCASKPAPVTPLAWSFGKDAIRLQLKSDPRLNLYDGVPHTLLLCMYQMTDPNAFNQLKEEKEGLPKLLECTRFDSSVASAKKQILQPGKEVTLSLDRAEGAKYVGIVGGYYLLQKEQAVRLFPIPIVEEEIDQLRRMKAIKPGFLDLQLYFGPQEIQQIKGK